MSWKKVKLGAILKRRKESIRIEPDRDYKLVTIKLYHKGVILRRIAKGVELGSSMSAIKAGDFILSGIDARNGAFGIVPTELDGAIVTNDFWCLDPDEKQIDKEFLLFLTSTDFFDYICKQSSDGTTQRIRLQKDRFFNYEISLPSIEEQKQILNKLKKCEFDANALSLELRYQQDIIKQLGQAFLREAMQGKLTKQEPSDGHARDLLAQIKLEKAKSGKKEKPLPPMSSNEIPFEIPKNWEWCRLGELCSKIGSGSTPNGSNYVTSGVPFFRSQNIYNDKLIYDDIKYISDEVHKQMKGTVVFADDVLLNITGGSLGRCAIVPKDFLEGNVSQHVCIIRPIILRSKFLHYLILAPFFQKYIFSSTTGAGREGLPKYNLEQFAIPLPPLKEQGRIVQKLDELMKYCNDLEQSIGESQARTDKLLQQVLREALQPQKKLQAGKPAIEPPIPMSDLDKRDLLAAYAILKADKNKNFGHIKLVKHMHPMEYHAETPMPTAYGQNNNGPYDKTYMETLAYRLRTKGWFDEYKDGSSYAYKPMDNADQIEALVSKVFPEKKAQLDFVIDVLNKANDKQAEIIATVYAVWNDLLINHMDASIEKIKLYFFRWSEHKMKAFKPEQVEACYKWMNEIGLIPKGTGRIIMRFA